MDLGPDTPSRRGGRSNRQAKRREPALRSMEQIHRAIPTYDLLGSEALDRIHAATLAILQDPGIDFRDDEAAAIWKAAGADVRGHREILVDGVDVMSLSPERLRDLRQSQMSMVFQKFALLPHRTVLDNTALALRIRGTAEGPARNEARKWLARVKLTGVDGHFPHQLSGGMQQRVGIARALTSNAPIMLMDEAFSALDPLIRTDMQDLLLELQKDLRKTIVFITHDLDEALKIADHLVILKDGTIVQQGEPQSILLNPSDPYIEAFVSDINRARVLRVRSVMGPLRGLAEPNVSAVDCEARLEDVLALSGGDIARRFVVTENGHPVGELHMQDLVKALVPVKARPPSL